VITPVISPHIISPGTTFNGDKQPGSWSLWHHDDARQYGTPFYP